VGEGMRTSFQLDTLKIRLNAPEWQPLDLHVRIARALRAMILDGALPPGTKLPATRSLSRSLDVARDTVENAYVHLHRDGYIVRRAGSGSYVSKTLGAPLRGSASKRNKRQAIAGTTTAEESGLSRRGRMLLASGGVTDSRVIKAFATGLPETRTFPTAIWERLQRKVAKDYRSHVLLHGDPQGAESLRRAIATYLNLERGANAAPENILVLSSTRQALFLCAQLLADVGKPIPRLLRRAQSLCRR